MPPAESAVPSAEQPTSEKQPSPSMCKLRTAPWAQLPTAFVEEQEKKTPVAARTDNDITDEAIWQARSKLFKESVERKSVDAKALAAENSRLNAKLKAAAVTKTDTDISDEAAGMARKELAAAAEKRRAEQARQLAAENAKARRARPRRRSGWRRRRR